MESLPDKEDWRNIFVATMVFGISFAAFFQALAIKEIVLYTFLSGIVILTREVGFRAVAEWMNSDVETGLSLDGSVFSIFGAFTAIVTQLPVILLFPLWNEASTESHRHWGKTVDSLWLKRKFWLHLGAVTALIIGWIFSMALNSVFVARMYSLTALFFMLPFDYENLPGEKLDGAFILRWNGFAWLVMTGLTLILYALTF